MSADGPIQYGSVCSGIEAASVAWHPLGWRSSFYSEIEPFPRAVLAHHYPEVPLHGDFTTIRAGDYAPIDLLVGGTPCQSFSIAGLRKGLDDPRGNLMLGFGALAQRLRPRWLVWENVPGVLSSNGGRDFGTFLGMLGILGYGFAYRVLDAQYFGVPQRRRRVFVVGYFGDWRRAAAVLFERHSLQGNPAPRREAGQGSAIGTLAGTSPGGGWRCGADEAAAGQLIPICVSTGQASAEIGIGIGTTLNCNHEAPYIAHTLRGEGFDASEDGTGRGTPPVPVAYRTTGNDGCYETGDQVGALTTGTDRSAQVVAFQSSQSGIRVGESHATLDANNGSRRQNGVIQASAVRRLTPRECERLQGFPDQYTDVPYRGKPAADGPRYKALGNSMAVPCMAWIGRRIEAIERISVQRVAA